MLASCSQQPDRISIVLAMAQIKRVSKHGNAEFKDNMVIPQLNYIVSRRLII